MAQLGFPSVLGGRKTSSGDEVPFPGDEVAQEAAWWLLDRELWTLGLGIWL